MTAWILSTFVRLDLDESTCAERPDETCAEEPRSDVVCRTLEQLTQGACA